MTVTPLWPPFHAMAPSAPHQRAYFVLGDALIQHAGDVALMKPWSTIPQ
ncbi:MAG: hypothetical protein R2838_26565 [Caldilineaceae bacterium]